jgi:hypothetical protein
MYAAGAYIITITPDEHLRYEYHHITLEERLRYEYHRITLTSACGGLVVRRQRRSSC